jgi:hypothetical protein
VGKSGEGHLSIDDFCPLKKNMCQALNEADPTNPHRSLEQPHEPTHTISFAEPPPTNITIIAPARVDKA